MSHNYAVPHDIINNTTNNFFSSAVFNGTSSSATYRSPTTAEGKQPYFYYMGVAGINSENAEVQYIVDTGNAVSISWAEIGIFRGDFTLGGGASLTRLGYTDISTQIFSVGTGIANRKKINVALDQPIKVGDQLWVAVGLSASTMGQFHGYGRADEIQSGVFQTITTGGRPSTLSVPVTTTVVTNPAFYGHYVNLNLI